MRSSVSARQPVNQIVGISDYFIITFFTSFQFMRLFSRQVIWLLYKPQRNRLGAVCGVRLKAYCGPGPVSAWLTAFCVNPPLLVLVWVQESHLQIAIINLTLWWCHHAWLIELGSTLSTFWPIVSETIPHGAPGTSFARWFIWTGI